MWPPAEWRFTSLPRLRKAALYYLFWVESRQSTLDILLSNRCCLVLASGPMASLQSLDLTEGAAALRVTQKHAEACDICELKRGSGLRGTGSHSMTAEGEG
jgi:hypothetical protein